MKKNAEQPVTWWRPYCAGCGNTAASPGTAIAAISMAVAACVTKGTRRKWRVENANNFLILFRAIVVGGDQLILAASKAGSIALSKVGKVGRSRRRRSENGGEGEYSCRCDAAHR
jgi:hypothetical protein